MGYGFIVWQIGSHIRRDQNAELSRIAETHDNAVSALQRLQQEATAPACSHDFLAEMQTIAFIPDGLNEFLYAPNGIVQCSTSQPKFEIHVPLGQPDVEGKDPGDLSLWIDRGLGFIRRPGATGTIAKLGDFAVVIPPYTRYQNDATWLKKEIVAVGPAGQVWNVAGDPGLYRRLSPSAGPQPADGLATVRGTQCDGQRIYCVASEANLFVWARDWVTILCSIAVLAALFAWICAINIISWLNRYWSFEAQFCRGLNAQSVVVAYQPILDLSSGKISGCEVLARWRDIDGTIAAPNRFIEIVERTGRTLAFTQMVVDRAHEELCEHIPPNLPLQINFNAFGCDFDSETLLRVFSKFIGRESQFNIAVELVESEDIDFVNAQLAIEELGRAGVKTYIDDFGTGYSSIERVATLAVHGVKLDRSFAMSPTDSILGRMLVQVLEMIRTSGRLIVVEGVETEARLNLLRSTGIVDCVQGYVVSRPLGIDEFVALLGSYGTAAKGTHLAA